MPLSIRRSALALLIPLAFSVAACDGEGLPGLGTGQPTVPGEGPAETEPPATDSPETAPPETDPPETAPPATDSPETEPPATDAPDDPSGDGGFNWGVMLAILIGLGVVAAIMSAANKRRSAPGSATAQPAAAPDNRRQLIATTRWVHDQFALEVLALPPADARQRWNAERGRLDQLTIDLRVQAAEADPEVWSNLSVAVAQLTSSLDTAVRLRSTVDVDEQMAQESVAIANRHRAEMQAWLVAAERTI
jgi:hypothetical protein